MTRKQYALSEHAWWHELAATTPCPELSRYYRRLASDCLREAYT